MKARKLRPWSADLKLLASVLVVPFVVAFVITYWTITKVDSNAPASASTDNHSAEHRGLPVVPTAQEISDRTIDTTTDGWDAPFLQEWAQKERYDQEVNGIRIGPSVAIESSACASREVEPLDADETLGTAMAISLAYVPSSARVEPDVNRMATGTAALACSDGTILANHVIVGIPAADDAVERIAQGESWFDVPHGGYVQISRMQLGAVDPPGVRTDIPASHWIDGQVAGHPAAIGKPVLDEGLGPAEVVIWDETTRILTFVHSYNVALTELIAIAEGVQ